MSTTIKQASISGALSLLLCSYSPTSFGVHGERGTIKAGKSTLETRSPRKPTPLESSRFAEYKPTLVSCKEELRISPRRREPHLDEPLGFLMGKLEAPPTEKDSREEGNVNEYLEKLENFYTPLSQGMSPLQLESIFSTLSRILRSEQDPYKGELGPVKEAFLRHSAVLVPKDVTQTPLLVNLLWACKQFPENITNVANAVMLFGRRFPQPVPKLISKERHRWAAKARYTIILNLFSFSLPSMRGIPDAHEAMLQTGFFKSWDTFPYRPSVYTSLLRTTSEHIHKLAPHLPFVLEEDSTSITNQQIVRLLVSLPSEEALARIQALRECEERLIPGRCLKYRGDILLRALNKPSADLRTFVDYLEERRIPLLRHIWNSQVRANRICVLLSGTIHQLKAVLSKVFEFHLPGMTNREKNEVVEILLRRSPREIKRLAKRVRYRVPYDEQAHREFVTKLRSRASGWKGV